MWLLTHDEGGPGGDVFKGKKIWLRPGKKYLFGRTLKEPGQIIIQDTHVSRKHLTIEIANIPEGQGTDILSRAKVTVQDLGAKLGSWVNGKSITGESFDLIKDDNEIKLGKQGTVLRIKWHPVVFSFTFTKAEIDQGDALATLRQALEPLDIKYVTDGRPTGFTHLVSKKRNNSKVMQALIHCQLVVSQAFTDAVVRAAVPTAGENGIEAGPLEVDFEGNWPDATKFVPAGSDGVDEAFAPDERRRDIFDGYTFIFYDKRYENMLPVITAGKGKALLRNVVPGKTDVTDFIRYVKSVAGEKGLGEFEDGSEGRGVVVVRYTPPGDGEDETWFKHFFNEFALRLDHRPIEIRELLVAVLDVEPAQLRRPLLLEPTPRDSATQHQDPSAPALAMEVDDAPPSLAIQDSPSPPPVPARKTRSRRAAAQSKFKSFDVGPGSEEDEAPAIMTTTQPPPAAAESQGMFMTQQSDVNFTQAAATAQRKRPANIMDLVAPNAARNKRQRVERGEPPLPTPTARTPTPEAEPELEPEPEPAPAPAKKGRTGAGARKGKGKQAADGSGDDLDAMIERGQEEEAARRAADDLLRRQLEGGEIDFGGIRDATATQTMPLRRRQQQPRQPDEERWNPHWNGLTNFKKFRPQNDVDGARARAPPRKIVSVVPVRAKEYGISDEYWLEDGDKRKKKKEEKQKEKQKIGHRSGGEDNQTQTPRDKTPVVISDEEDDGDDNNNNNSHNISNNINDDDDDDDASLPDIVDVAPVQPPPPVAAPQSRSRKGKIAERATQAQAQAQTQTQTTRQTRTKKRAVAPVAQLGAERPAKKRATRASKQRAAAAAAVAGEEGEEEEEEEDSDDEDGGIRFRFGKRR